MQRIKKTAAFRIPVLFLIQGWTFRYIERLTMSLYKRVIHFWKWSSFLSHPVVYVWGAFWNVGTFVFGMQISFYIFGITICLQINLSRFLWWKFSVYSRLKRHGNYRNLSGMASVTVNYRPLRLYGAELAQYNRITRACKRASLWSNGRAYITRRLIDFAVR